MFPHPMSRSELSASDRSLPPSDLARILEQHVQAGFPQDLALDLVLNELVVRAADATHASAAALALIRGDEMVCRAATGLHAPDLGIPLNTRDGLSGACVRTRTPQISGDAESDPRVDPAISRRLGVRSMLMVPVFDALDDAELSSGVQPALAGVLEVLSPLPDAFDDSSQSVLEGFARECSRVRRAAAEMPERPPAPAFLVHDADILPPDAELSLRAAAPLAASPDAVRPARLHQPYESWALVLGTLVILAAAGFSFLIGSRIGWLGSPPAAEGGPAPSLSAPSKSPAPARSVESQKTKPAVKPAAATPPPSTDELVIYEKGKVIFRMKPAPGKGGEKAGTPDGNGETAPASPNTAGDTATRAASVVVPASSSARIASPHPVWLAPAQAESRLLHRVEPEYPADALAAHRSGTVTLEVHVGEDGSVSSVRPLSGDPLLAAAAVQAVRGWRYQPYRPNEQASPFQTDVTLKFSLPN